MSASFPAPPHPPPKAPILYAGNPVRFVRGGVTTLVASLLAFALMAHKGQLRAGVPLGIVFVLVASFGVMDFCGTFDDEGDRVAKRLSFSSLARPLGATLGSLLLFCLALGFAGAGVLVPPWVWGLVVTATFLGLTASAFQLAVTLGVMEKDEAGRARPLLERHGFWVLAAAAALYFPLMGAFSLWDPWETHYGEVSREILARDDWISLWWVQDGWFFSKPILDFWLQAISMATLGVHYLPDQMLVGENPASHDARMHPEWIVRAPIVLLTILSMYVLYKGAAKAFGRRAGLLGALVLATMPDWFLLAHQTMTDMPFVAPMAASMGLLLVGLYTDEHALAKSYQVGRFRLTAWHLVFGAILVVVLPQIFYLLSRNLEIDLHAGPAHWIRPHLDEFQTGSGGGNCGLPGNEACTPQVPSAIWKGSPGRPEGFDWKRDFLSWEPWQQAFLWTVALFALVAIQRGERRVRRLAYLGAWFFAAVATMAKGPAGFGLPMLGAFLYVCVTKKWKELARFEIWSGFFLIIPCVALPWFVAMRVRHGAPFVERLITHDMWERAVSHVHDTNEGDETSFRFYVWQLGYALFPFIGLAPAGLSWWTKQDDSARRGAAALLFFWFLSAFALFSYMGTKFHHYIFPAVPPLAMLVGVVLDKMMGRGAVARRGWTLPYFAGVTGGVAVAAYGASRLWQGSILGTVPLGQDLSGPAPRLQVIVGGALLLFGVVATVGAAVAFRARYAEPPPEVEEPNEPPASVPLAGAAPYRDAPPRPVSDLVPRRRAHASVMLAGSVVSGAVLVALVGRDLAMGKHNTEPPGAIRLLHLFTYNYKRPWPDSLDFHAVLAGFALVFVLASFAMAVRAIRRHAVVAFLALSFVWALWATDIYMVETAPHWGQHELVEKYYRTRKDPSEILVAYQMNWKGEAFYTGNRMATFVSTGTAFTTWLKKKREEGVTELFFVTEHSRVGGLKSEVSGKSYEELTTVEDNNKFVLVRAEL